MSYYEIDWENMLGPFYQRAQRADFWIVTTITVMVWILFFVIYFVGLYSDWYNQLKQPNINVWIPRVGWVIASGISYLGLYLLWRNVSQDRIPQLLAISVLYAVGAFIMIAWVLAFFYAQNIGLAAWIAAVLFIFQFWLFIFIWYINYVSALLTLPLVLMYLYLAYSMVNLASLNNVPL